MKPLAITAALLILVTGPDLPKFSYTQDPTISNQKGEPAQDSTFYFLLEHFIDTIRLHNPTFIVYDTASVQLFSEQLKLMKEPVLYNYYLNKSIYRLTLLRSFHPAIVIRLENIDGEVLLTQKKLVLINPWKTIDEDTMVYKPDSVQLEEKFSRLKSEFWKEWESVLIKHRYGKMPTKVAHEWGVDGAEWILEEHREDGYYVVNRWSPSRDRHSDFRALGDILLDASRYKKEERY